MKIEYVRNMQFGYMRLELTNPLSKTEEAMLEQNVIEGILPVRRQQENDKYLLRYDITGKQALDGMLENAQADEKLLKNLLVGIYVAVKQLEKYLLHQDGLSLSPETIFFDYKTETMHFCYFPGEEEPLQVRFVKLMEYMLAKTDHKNILAVQLAYGIYEEIQKPSFCMEDLQNYLQEKSVRSPDYAEPIGVEAEGTGKEESVRLQKRVPINVVARKYMQKAEWKEQIMAWVKEKIQKLSKRKRAEEAVIFETEAIGMETAATTILNAGEDRTKGCLKYEGSNFLPDIPIAQVPFVIGSAGDCDGVIRHPNISRYHAKITYRDNTYFIEDLNSTNGTRVNGGLLSYKTKISLEKNSNIYFANELYRFI